MFIFNRNKYSLYKLHVFVLSFNLFESIRILFIFSKKRSFWLWIVFHRLLQWLLLGKVLKENVSLFWFIFSLGFHVFYIAEPFIHGNIARNSNNVWITFCNASGNIYEKLFRSFCFHSPTNISLKLKKNTQMNQMFCMRAHKKHACQWTWWRCWWKW